MHNEVVQNPKPRQEAAYVLRLWCDGEGAWRYSLEPLKQGRRQIFTSLVELEAYLLERTAGSSVLKEKP